MKKALGKKWFLLTDEITAVDEANIPSREVRIFVKKLGGYDLRITGVIKHQSYECIHEIRFDGLHHPTHNNQGSDSTISEYISDSKYVGSFFENGNIVSTSSSEIIKDKFGNEILQVIEEKIQDTKKSYIKIFKYISSKL